MKAIFVIYILINGQQDPRPIVLESVSADCREEHLVIAALNQENQKQHIQIHYTGLCGVVARTIL